MKKIMILIQIVLLLNGGCKSMLRETSSPVSVAPISDTYMLKKPEGVVCVLPPEMNTGQEQLGSIAVSSLAKIIEKNNWDLNITAISFPDLVNRINGNDMSNQYAEMKKFYEQNNMFRKSDLNLFGEKLGIDYFALPRVLEIKRWNEGRFSAGGMKILTTHKINIMTSLEIWSSNGYLVFIGTADVCVADESFRSRPLSIEEGYQVAWKSILKELSTTEEEKQIAQVKTPAH